MYTNNIQATYSDRVEVLVIDRVEQNTFTLHQQGIGNAM